MAELTNKQKKEWAAMLYLKENLTQQEIAEKVGISRVTVNKWIKAEMWEQRKAGLTLTREEQISLLYQQVAEINRNIKDREEGKRFATSKEADVLIKLSSAIKKMETESGIADIIGVGMRFIEFLRPVNLELAKDVTRMFDLFVKSSIKQ
ncbi:helix-turn-helix domain-containing protein [Parabacteroides goldsteinii]|uniref:helix-turn-helix domain-containing protein n=1 Tax=Parabacteroides goldsteinii TaxID=328812 RepID=UPI003AB23EC0